MVKLLITVEGQSEEEFVKRVLTLHLTLRGIIVQVRPIRTSRTQSGGNSSYDRLRFRLAQWLREQPDGWHTTLLDLFRLPAKFPGLPQAAALARENRAEFLEAAFAADVNHPRFRPYLQQYEFEALLFTDPKLMEEWLGLYAPLPPDCFLAIRDRFPTPEDINGGAETAPSKRIVALCRSYDKVDDAPNLLAEIGLTRLRATCPRFGAWLTWLESLGATV